MSMNFEVWERFGRPALNRAEYPVLSSSDPRVAIVLKRVGPLDQAVSVARRLRQVGVRLPVAHTVINELAASARAFCAVAAWTDFDALAADLAAMNVVVLRRSETGELASGLTEILCRHGLSVQALADRLGLDVRTLQNWEQGRNRPDAAVLTLVTLFDRHPDLVEAAVYETVAPAA